MGQLSERNWEYFSHKFDELDDTSKTLFAKIGISDHHRNFLQSFIIQYFGNEKEMLHDRDRRRKQKSAQAQKLLDSTTLDFAPKTFAQFSSSPFENTQSSPTLTPFDSLLNLRYSRI